AQVLGGGRNSLLYRALVVDQGLAVSAYAWYQGTAVDASQFGVSATPTTGVEFPRHEAALAKVIADVADNGIATDDLEDAKTQLIAETIYAQDSQAKLARWYGAALTVGLSLDDVRQLPETIRAVTAEEVRAAARNYLTKIR